MGSAKRAAYLVTGIFMLLASLLMMVSMGEAYRLVLLCLELALLIRGIRMIIYYFMLARHMVGGILILYEGIVVLDAALFAMNMDNLPRQYAMLYLIVILMVSGIIDVLRGNEARKMKSGHWRYQLFLGIAESGMGVLCLFFLDSALLVTMIYAVGLLYSAISRIVTAFRKTAIVYIE